MRKALCACEGGPGTSLLSSTEVTQGSSLCPRDGLVTPALEGGTHSIMKRQLDKASHMVNQFSLKIPHTDTSPRPWRRRGRGSVQLSRDTLLPPGAAHRPSSCSSRAPTHCFPMSVCLISCPCHPVGQEVLTHCHTCLASSSDSGRGSVNPKVKTGITAKTANK